MIDKMSSSSSGLTSRALRATLRLLYEERNALNAAIRRLEGTRFRPIRPVRAPRRGRAVLVAKPR